LGESVAENHFSAIAGLDGTTPGSTIAASSHFPEHPVTDCGWTFAKQLMVTKWAQGSDEVDDLGCEVFRFFCSFFHTADTRPRFQGSTGDARCWAGGSLTLPQVPALSLSFSLRAYQGSQSILLVLDSEQCWFELLLTVCALQSCEEPFVTDNT
jgi:hypothetical protein